MGSVFYQSEPFWASDDINVLDLKNKTLTPELFGYLGTCLSKSGSKFSYSYKWNVSRMLDTIITLPILTNSDNQPVLDDKCKPIPDWDYMEKYIRAIEKMTIKDVVLLKYEIIERTKNIIGKR